MTTSPIDLSGPRSAADFCDWLARQLRRGRVVAADLHYEDGGPCRAGVSLADRGPAEPLPESLFGDNEPTDPDIPPEVS